jgi:hypothetical protein
MGWLPLDQDPNVPDGIVPIAEIVVSQYMKPDGAIGIRTHYDGDLPLSSVLGLLALGGIDIYDRCERGAPDA